VHAVLTLRTIQFQDSPDPAKRPATTRTVLSAKVYKGSPIPFLEKLNQDFHYEYVLKGHRLIHNDIIITLFQIFKLHSLHEIKDGIEPIDLSGGWILQAVVLVENPQEQPLALQALEELKQLKVDLMQNLGLELEVADRILLDTRTRALAQP
jgi:mediator of RNA polymerase II transcription subunit 18, fungi type